MAKQRSNRQQAEPGVRPKCGAIKPNGIPCGLGAGHGTDHPGAGPCSSHFGNTKVVVRGAAIDQGADVARKLRGMGVEKDIDPIDALVWDVRLTAGIVEWHKSVIDTWTTRKSDGSFIALTVEQEAFYARYQAERDHLMKASRMAIAGNVTERAITLAERQAGMLADAIEEILAKLGLDQRQQDLVPEVVPDVLRAVAVRVPIIGDDDIELSEETALMLRSGDAPKDKLPVPRKGKS